MVDISSFKMKNKILILLLFISTNTFAQQCPIIPLPNKIEALPGIFILNNNTPVIFKKAKLEKEANYLQQELLKTTGVSLSIQSNNNLPSISLVLSHNKENNTSSYKLEIHPDGIKVISPTEQGIFYGIVSLMQLIRQSEIKNNTALISCWDIKDFPHYQWRGFMLDESRHFFGKQTVKEILDWMAFYKLNKFHWHLTDEPGWRIEIKAYPLLALIGGIGNFSNPLSLAQYYTQE